MDELLSPIHPGEVLLKDFMKPFGLSQSRLAIEAAEACNRKGEASVKTRRVIPRFAL